VNLISIDHTITLLALEDLHSRFTGDDGAVLRLPSSLRLGGWFGIPVGIIQFVATWARQVKDRTLKAYGGQSGPSAMATLLKEPYGLAAVYFANHLVDPSGIAIARPLLLERAGEQITAMQAMDFRQTMAGRGVFLACFAGARNEFLNPLYSRPTVGHIRGRQEFETLTTRIISTCAPSFARHLPTVDLEAISALLFELFKNTDDHATSDELGRSYAWKYQNIRGMLAKFISSPDPAQLTTISEGDAGLRIFLSRSLLQKTRLSSDPSDFRRKGSNSFLELTVFDTGPGLVRRWLAARQPEQRVEQLTIEEETNLVVRCFELRATTKSVHGSGVGLDSVLRTLWRLGAFLRLRSGRVCLWQDFSGQETRGFKPKHWLKDRTQLGIVAGTSYSILIPLSRAR
jgi:hypothetical protein